MNYTENVIVPGAHAFWSRWTRANMTRRNRCASCGSLQKAAARSPIATMMQKRPSPETATCVGSGMVEEIRNFCENNEIELIIFDRELTPTQIRNLENATDVRVVDRTMLISIFLRSVRRAAQVRCRWKRRS